MPDQVLNANRILRVVTRVEGDKNLGKVEFLAFFGICKLSFWDSWKKSSYPLLGLAHCFASKRQNDITKVKKCRSSRLNGLEKECSSWIKCRLAGRVIKLQKISDHVKSCGTLSQNNCEHFKLITQVVLEKGLFKVPILRFWKLCYLTRNRVLMRRATFSIGKPPIRDALGHGICR